MWSWPGKCTPVGSGPRRIFRWTNCWPSGLRRRAALQIDKGIAGVEGEEEQRPAEKEQEAPFQAVKPKRRRPGTGCVSQINDHLWEGRYSPKWIDGKKHARNVYAKTEAECEEKLAALILEMKKELSELREKEK